MAFPTFITKARRDLYEGFNLILCLSLSVGVSRIARRSSVNTVKPPPPVRRSSSVTPSHHGDTNVSFHRKVFFFASTQKNLKKQIDKTDTKFTLNLNSKLINHSLFFTISYNLRRFYNIWIKITKNCVFFQYFVNLDLFILNLTPKLNPNLNLTSPV